MPPSKPWYSVGRPTDAQRRHDGQFHSSRSQAIQAYAALESAMAELLREVLNLDHQSIGRIFWNISSNRSRMNIIRESMNDRLGEKFSPFRRSLVNELGKINTERNRIVHWHESVELGDKGYDIMLAAPASWMDDKKKFLRIDDLVDLLYAQFFSSD